MKKESLLWEISEKGSEVTSYLFGTMHVKNSDAFSYIDKAKSKIDLVHMYIGEMDLNDPDMESIHQHFMLENPLTLVDLLGLKKYEKARKIFIKAFKVDLDVLRHFKPLIVSNMIAESILTQEYDISLDHYLWNYALETDKVMAGLESVKDQIHIMESIAMKYQIKSLLDASKNVTKFRNKVLQLSKYYSEERLNDLYKVSRKSMGGLRKLMIYDRNHIMAGRLQNQLEKHTVFCSVGAAHLSGKYGLIALLKKKGYKVKPI